MPSPDDQRTDIPVAIIGMAALGETVNALKIASIALVIVGVVGLNLAGAE